jgi:hypothetical protein
MDIPGIVPGMIRTIVIIVDGVLGVAAVTGGGLAAAGAGRAARAWARALPFKSPLWLGLALLVVVGGSMLAAAGLLLAGQHLGRLVSVEAGVLLAGCSGFMLSASGWRRWPYSLQWLCFAMGVGVVLLSFALPSPGCPLVL